MCIKPNYWPIITCIIIVILLGYGLTQDPRVLPSALEAKPAPKFELTDLFSEKHKISNSIFKEHYTLVNIWASWCTPCRVEHNFLTKLKKVQPKLQWLGINYKDDVEMARTYLSTLGNPYDYAVADEDGTFGMAWGIYGTPETFLIDKKGRVLHRHAGVINEKIWKKEFAQYIR